MQGITHALVIHFAEVIAPSGGCKGHSPPREDSADSRSPATVNTPPQHKHLGY